MDIDVSESLKTAANRTFSRTGAHFIAAFAVISFVHIALLVGFSLIWFEGYFPAGFAFAVAVSVGLWLANIALSVIITIGMLRVFLGKSESPLQRHFFLENIGWVAINFGVGCIFFGFALVPALLLFVLPGVYLVARLLFWPIFIVEKNQNVIESFQSSWDMTRGNWKSLLPLSGIMVILFVGGNFTLLIAQGVLGVLLARVTVGAAIIGGVGQLMFQFLSDIGSAIIFVYLIVLLTDVYEQV
jgi:hypothetical protein